LRISLRSLKGDVTSALEREAEGLSVALTQLQSFNEMREQLCKGSRFEDDDDKISVAGYDGDDVPSADEEDEPSVLLLQQAQPSYFTHHMQLRKKNTPAQSGIIPTEVGSYLGFLSLFITPAMANDFVRHTNSDAPASWPGTTESELYAFIGGHIYTGIDRLAVLED